MPIDFLAGSETDCLRGGPQLVRIPLISERWILGEGCRHQKYCAVSLRRRHDIAPTPRVAHGDKRGVVIRIAPIEQEAMYSLIKNVTGQTGNHPSRVLAGALVEPILGLQVPPLPHPLACTESPAVQPAVTDVVLKLQARDGSEGTDPRCRGAQSQLHPIG